MNKYSFEVSIEAQTQGEAEVKCQAASVLMQKVKGTRNSKACRCGQEWPMKNRPSQKALGL